MDSILEQDRGVVEAGVLLVVVDGPEQRAVFKHYLRATPHHLVFAVGDEDGRERFSECKPDLVVAAGAGSSAQLCQRLRRELRGEFTPILRIGDDIQQTSSSGGADADGYLPDSFTQAVLLEIITSMLAVGRSRVAGARVSGAPTDTEDLGCGSRLDVDAGEFDASRQMMFGGIEARKLRTSADEVAPAGEFDIETVVSLENPFLARSHEALNAPARERTDAATKPGRRSARDPRANAAAEKRVAPRRQSTLRSQRIAKVRRDQQPDPGPPPRVSQPARSLIDEPVIPAFAQPPDRSSQSTRAPEAMPIGSSGPRARDELGQRRGLDESQLGKRLTKRVRSMFRMLAAVDYYQLLGLEPGASLEAIRRAYLELSLELHSDRFFLLPSADLKEKCAAICHRLDEAFEVLSNAARRAAYDRALREGDQQSAAQAASASLPLDVVGSSESELGALANTREGAPFLAAAQRWLDDDDAPGARLALMLARLHEPDNPTIAQALEGLIRRSQPPR